MINDVVYLFSHPQLCSTNMMLDEKCLIIYIKELLNLGTRHLYGLWKTWKVVEFYWYWKFMKINNLFGQIFKALCLLG